MLLLLPLIVFQTMTTAQNGSSPVPDSCQMDFWIGDWNLDWKDAAGKTQTGFNNVEKIMDGYVVRENFTTGDNTFKGTSLSLFNKNLGKWQQTWVDNSGAYLDFTGEFKDGKMILSREAKRNTGDIIHARMVFYNITKDEFDWNWEKSTDNGSTWTLMWHIHYLRKI